MTGESFGTPLADQLYAVRRYAYMTAQFTVDFDSKISDVRDMVYHSSCFIQDRLTESIE